MVADDLQQCGVLNALKLHFSGHWRVISGMPPLHSYCIEPCGYRKLYLYKQEEEEDQCAAHVAAMKIQGRTATAACAAPRCCRRVHLQQRRKIRPAHLRTRLQ